MVVAAAAAEDAGGAAHGHSGAADPVAAPGEESSMIGRGRRGFVTVNHAVDVHGALHFLVRSRHLRALMASFVPVVPSAGSSALVIPNAEVANAVAAAFRAQWSEETGAVVGPASADRVAAALAAVRALHPSDHVIPMQRVQVAVREILFALGEHIPEIGPLFTSVITQTFACSVSTLGRTTESLVTAEIRLLLEEGRGESHPMTLWESIEGLLSNFGGGSSPAAGARFTVAAPLLLMPQERENFDNWLGFPVEFWASDLVIGAEGFYRLIAVSHYVAFVPDQNFLIDFLHPDDGIWYRCNNYEVNAIAGGGPILTGPSQNILMYELDLVNEPRTLRRGPREVGSGGERVHLC